MTNNNELRIENVIIKKDAKGLVFLLPQSFDGETFRKFKEVHKAEILDFKNETLKTKKL
jgi:hypothetical protein